jgi:hypothetical protein
MSATGALLYTDEAIRFIEQIPDPVTRSLVNLAFVRLVKEVHLQPREQPRTDIDTLFLVKSPCGFFSEHDVLARALEGEKVGAWFAE